MDVRQELDTMTAREIRGSDPTKIVAFTANVRKTHPMSIPGNCLCTWVVTVNRIWLLKFESNLCPHKGRH